MAITGTTGTCRTAAAAPPRRGVWWMSVDGGPEASQLANLTGLGRAGHRWPRRTSAAAPVPEVVMVCQATPTGAMAAVRTVDAWLLADRPAPLRGLVAVAGGAAVTPAVADRIDVVSTWVKVWRMGWGGGDVTDPAQALGVGDVAALRWFVARAKPSVSAEAQAFARRLRLDHRSRGW